jgi:tetratricopeptide (TPR) repeat protein
VRSGTRAATPRSAVRGDRPRTRATGAAAARTSRHGFVRSGPRTAPYRGGYGYRRSYPYYRSNHYHHHGYYPRSGFYLSFSFGWGAYYGWPCYYPYYHYYSGRHYGFFYSYPATYCYVPFGFYVDTAPLYVTRYVYVTEKAPDYEVVEQESEPAPETQGKEPVDTQPAADSPVTEKYLREASDLFREAKYLEAAKKFRLAAISSPDNAAPYFALGQALIAMGSYEYAAKVIRKAVALNPELVREAGDIVGVYQSQEEFDKVVQALEAKAAQSPAGSDLRFLAGVQRYFAGDPRARESFRALAEVRPDDAAVKLFGEAVEKRFKAEEELPPVK